MTSPRFDIDGDQLSFLIGGGQRGDGSLQAELLIDGQVVRTQTGQNDGALQWSSWDVAEFRGQQAQLRIRDEATGGWGHLTFDHLVVGDEASQPRSSETSINLMVDGRVVRTATGADSEHLDWKSWNVAELVGQEATIRIVDNNRGAWGHILADQVTFADAPVPVAGQGYDWLDWGRDYYAAVSYSGTPSGSRLMQAWMNNWEYAGDIPTSPWRSSMTLPREVVLVTTPAGPRLQQRVVSQISGQLDVGAAQSRTDVRVDGATALELSGDVAKLDITLRPGDADQAGITVFSNGDAGTRIGYDVRRERIFIDRTASGNLGFSPAFASVDDAPLALEDGTVTLEVYLDRASVELFAAEGLVTLTDQVFPEAGATSISAWSDGGTATIEHITVTPLMPTMWTTVTPPEDGEPSITLSAEAVEAGDAVTVSGTRFHAGESLSIELRSAPVEIGTTTTDEHGAFSRAVKIPVDTPIGPHAIVVTRSDGSELTLPLIVTTAEGESDEADGEQPTDLAEEENLRETSADDLARTGDVPPWRILAIGTLLTVLGTVFMQRRRRAR
ncbi:hypothetical protein GCM10025863_01370 [Microbacterium suwonense]|uniref:Uncharacterized protein n=2 Tax=Microbacterium suwonense TaxID=683047 RepID=A0ABM8FP96_9MICO|nr:hypothetical protein GCM10025863_01370 [Microbacterium suwonense]